MVDTREVTALVSEITRDLAHLQQCLVDLQHEVDTMAGGGVEGARGLA